MSWKSLITAGLLCVLASPAFAAPTMTIVKGGTFANGNLDVNGNWVWKVQITPDLAILPDATGTPVAAELGFTSTNRNLLGVSNANAAVFDTNNPATSIFPAWEVTYGSPLKPEGLEANFAGASAANVINTASLGGHAVTAVSGAANQVIAAFGSANISTPGAKDFLQLTAAGPTTTGGALSTTIQTSGAYGGKGRIAQINGGTSGGPYTTGNFDTFNAAATRTVHSGDANMDGNVDGLDLAIMASNFGGTGKHWYQTDYNGDNSVDGLDLATLASNFGFSGPPPGAGSGSGLGSSNVPEPASIAMIGLGLLGGLGLIRRKR